MLCVYDVRTSQETRLWASIICYVDSFICYVYMMFVRHRKHMWASIVCYGDSLICYVYMMFVRHRKHAYGPPSSVTRIASYVMCIWCSYVTENAPLGLHRLLRGQLICYVHMMFDPHRKHTYRPPSFVNGNSFAFLYVDHMNTCQETHLRLHGHLRR
jgi:cbb3-type cytochrome oxidase subunit 3